MDERYPSQASFGPAPHGDPYGQPSPFTQPGFSAAAAAPAGYVDPGYAAPTVPPAGYPPASGAAAPGYGYPSYGGLGYGVPGYGVPGGLPPGMYPPGYNPWLGSFAGPRYASVWLRIAAYFIDSLVLGVINVVAYLTVIVATTSTGQAGAPTIPPTAMLAAIILVLVLDGIYFVAQEASSGQTLGKRVVGTKVVKADGSEMTVDAALIRYLFLLLAGLGLGGLVTVIMVALSDTKQRLGDRVAGTIVVRAG